MKTIIDSFKGRYSFLSNFYPIPIHFDDDWYHSVEHAYQAAKTHDRKLRVPFQGPISPALAKRMGRHLLLRPDWEQVKDGVMLTLLHWKFSGALGAELLATGHARLIEGNTWGDRYWGVYHGEGQNMLGFLLMQVRHELCTL